MTIFLAGFLTNLALIVAVGAQTLFLLRQIVRRDHALTALLVCFAGDALLLLVGAGGIGAVAERHPSLVTGLTAAGVAYLLWFAVGSFRAALRGDRTLASAAAEADAGIAPDAADVAALTGQLPLIDGRTGRVSGDDATRQDARAAGGDVRGGSDREQKRVRDDDASGAGSHGLKTRVEPRRVRLEVPRSPRRRIILLALSVSLLNPHAMLDLVVMLGTFAQTYGDAKWVYTAGAITASVLWFTVLGWGGTRLAPYMNAPRTWRIVDTVVGVLMLVIAAKVTLTLF